MTLGSNPKLRLDVSYSYSKFGVNRPKQTKVIERKPKGRQHAHTPTRPPARRRLQHYNNPVFVENLVKTLVKVHTCTFCHYNNYTNTFLTRLIKEHYTRFYLHVETVVVPFNPHAEQISPGWRYTQQTARVTQQFLALNNFAVLKWSAMFLDMSPIEHYGTSPKDAFTLAQNHPPVDVHRLHDAIFKGCKTIQ